MNKRDAQIICNNIVSALTKERINQGISQYKMAKDIGMSKSSISYIENQTQTPSLRTIIIIADYLGVKLNVLLDDKKASL